MKARPQRNELWLVGLAVLGYVAYCSPWIINPCTSLSLGAYDLAEWGSLHPTVRSSTLPLLMSLFLRLPFTCLGILTAMTISRRSTSLGLAVIFLTGVALFPPLEFFTQYQGDPNFQQLFALGVGTWIIGGVCMLVREIAFLPLVVLASIIGGIGCLLGLTQGLSLMRNFELPTHIGTGGIGLMVVFGLMVFIYGEVLSRLKQTRQFVSGRTTLSSHA